LAVPNPARAYMHMMDMARALLEHKGAGEPVFK